MSLESINLITKIKTFPDLPGVYLFKDNNNEIVYVGKAKDLRKRISTYFLKEAKDWKTKELKEIIADVEFISTNTEIEALILENNLIKLHKPKLNAKLKDDKTYPYLKITTNEEYPRVEIVRKREDDNNIYFGPYANVKALRIALAKALTVFPIARCSKKIKPEKMGRSCLFNQLNRCLAPCTGKIDKENYQKNVQKFFELFKGNESDLLNELKSEMEREANQLNYEKAAVIRNKINALKKIMQKQIVVSNNLKAEYDILGIEIRNDIALIQVLIMRQGRIVEQKHFLMNLPFELTDSEILASFIKQYYATNNFIPRNILIKNNINDEEAINEWIQKILNLEKSNLIIIKPQIEEEQNLLDLAYMNAKINLNALEKELKIKEERIKNGLNELKEILNLEKIPTRIEGYDISTLQGVDSVGACVTFYNGTPLKKEYRKFIVKTIEKQDDFGSLKEVVRRRFTGNLAKSKIIPDLILIDGGIGQVSSVLVELNDVKIRVPIIGLSKELEQIHFPDKREPIILNERSNALSILKQIRDEAHRFAISFHRQRHTKKMFEISLNKIPNIGEKKVEKLLDYFKTFENIKNATIEDLEKVNGISHELAKTIFEYFRKISI